MVNKLRDVMGKRNDLYKLDGGIELDDAFFTTEIPIEFLQFFYSNIFEFNFRTMAEKTNMSRFI